jgi:hypothetical protein
VTRNRRVDRLAIRVTGAHDDPLRHQPTATPIPNDQAPSVVGCIVSAPRTRDAIASAGHRSNGSFGAEAPLSGQWQAQLFGQLVDSGSTAHVMPDGHSPMRSAIVVELVPVTGLTVLDVLDLACV